MIFNLQKYVYVYVFILNNKLFARVDRLNQDLGHKENFVNTRLFLC